MKYIAAITDIHGCLDELNILLEKVEDHFNGEQYQLLFLGDYIDRGPNSQGVIDRVRQLQEEKNAIVLLGNHEAMAVESYYTNKSYYDFQPKPEDIFWMKDLSVKFETDLHFFCHAGVYPGLPLEEQDPRHLIWIREIFLSHHQKFPKYIVHGHTPTNSYDEEFQTPSVLHNRCNLDTGKVFGGKLSCGIFDIESEIPIHTISI